LPVTLPVISSFLIFREKLKMKKSLLAVMIVALGVVACGKKEEVAAPAPAPVVEQKPADAAAQPTTSAPAEAPKK